MRGIRYLLAAAVVLAAGCDGDTSMSPTDTTTETETTTAASPTVSEQFTGTLPVGGFKFYSFTTSTYGLVYATLTAVGGNYVPATVQLSLGIGQPSGTDCLASTPVTTAPGTSPQVSGTYEPDVYCVVVADVGNLYAPADFSVTIDYP